MTLTNDWLFSGLDIGSVMAQIVLRNRVSRSHGRLVFCIERFHVTPRANRAKPHQFRQFKLVNNYNRYKLTRIRMEMSEAVQKAGGRCNRHRFCSVYFVYFIVQRVAGRLAKKNALRNRKASQYPIEPNSIYSSLPGESFSAAPTAASSSSLASSAPLKSNCF